MAVQLGRRLVRDGPIAAGAGTVDGSAHQDRKPSPVSRLPAAPHAWNGSNPWGPAVELAVVAETLPGLVEHRTGQNPTGDTGGTATAADTAPWTVCSWCPPG